MKIAILCSGQGTQHPDMFALTADAPAASDIFSAATDALDGKDPRELVKSQSATLHANVVGQILCCTQALAAFVVLRGAIGAGNVFGGYSIGELASWGCAGLIASNDVIGLAKQRAQAMDAASGANDGLVYVRGIERPEIEDLCDRYAAEIAIVNPGGLLVIGGDRDDLARLCEEAMTFGASKVGMLKVEVASHTGKLTHASKAFREALSAVRTRRLPPGARLISGIDGTSVTSVETGLDKLASQISRTIEWAACLESCVEAGTTTVLELGPGNALAEMVSAAYPSINARSLDDFRSLAGVEAWLSRARA